MIQKYSGENLFVPQYLRYDWVLYLIIRIIFSPFAFLFWLYIEDNKKWNQIKQYFTMWHDIPYDKTTFKERYFFYDSICDTKATAEQVIKVHKQDREDKFKKEQEEKIKIKMQKVKKVLYINVK